MIMAVTSFEKIFEKSPNSYMLLDRELRYVAANQAYLELTQSTREDIIGRNIFDVFPDDPDDLNRNSRALLEASLERVFTTGQPDVLAWIRYKLPRKTSKGTELVERHWSATHTPILNENGEVQFLLQHVVDISDISRQRNGPDQVGIIRRAQAVQEAHYNLQSEQRRLLQYFEQAPGFVAIVSGPDYVFELANNAFYKLVGERELLGRPLVEALPELTSRGSVEFLNNICRNREPYVGRGTEIYFQATDQSPARRAFVDFVLQPVQESDGSVSGIFIQGNQVTDRVNAEQELKRYREHLEDLVAERTQALKKSEAALQQAQKMEAVGRLTGGIAHDFNNLLQIIAGNLQLAQRDLGKDNDNSRRLQNALNAVDRGARLASQLLAFARRQLLEPRVINPAKLVEGLDDLLRQALGAAVETEIIIEDDLWNTFCDASQLENSILNLAINAHDAMEGDGKLIIELGNTTLDDAYAAQHDDVQAGDYVVLVVSDTGCGMPPEIVKQVFEPFFSTKSPDRGTGLGLSMVYGFVKQTGGHINIYSEEGIGTSVKIYLPRTSSQEQEEIRAVAAPVRGGDETILIVEDDDEVRDTVAQLLDDLGYRILRAADAASALAVLESGIPIDLLFTDVVMPGSMTAIDLARRAKALWPQSKVLFTSGYTETAAAHGGKLALGAKLISKPYRQEDLARRVRQLLDEKRERPKNTDGLPSRRILVVEDAVDVRHAVTVFLRNAGHQVVELGTAEAALDALADASFDVLITDVSLPGISGLALAERVEKNHPGMAIIVATGYGTPTTSDGYQWLQKPYDFAQLEAALEQVTGCSS